MPIVSRGPNAFPTSRQGQLGEMPTTLTAVNESAGIFHFRTLYCYNPTGSDSTITLALDQGSGAVTFYQETCYANGGKLYFNVDEGILCGGVIQWRSSQAGVIGYVSLGGL